MSTFSGFLDGIENVSVDRFTESNWQSNVFFLSHCHMDHMVGLNTITPDQQLPGPLYLSEVSQIIIRRRYPAIKDLIPLRLGGKLNAWVIVFVLYMRYKYIVDCIYFTKIETIPVTVDADKCDRISVTAIPAGHCPGSIMLLFEKDDIRILYTGDFR